MVKKRMTFSRERMKIFEVNFTIISSVAKKQRWVYSSPGNSCQKKYDSRLFWNTTNTGVSEASWLAWFSDVQPQRHQQHTFNINWRLNNAQYSLTLQSIQSTYC